MLNRRRFLQLGVAAMAARAVKLPGSSLLVPEPPVVEAVLPPSEHVLDAYRYGVSYWVTRPGGMVWQGIDRSSVRINEVMDISQWRPVPNATPAED